MYRTLTNIANKFFSDAQIYKYGFNWSPMYRRSTGEIIEVSEDLLYIKIILDSLYRFLPLFFGIEVTNSILNIFKCKYICFF